MQMNGNRMKEKEKGEMRMQPR